MANFRRSRQWEEFILQRAAMRQDPESVPYREMKGFRRTYYGTEKLKGCHLEESQWENDRERDRENGVNPIQSCPKMRGVVLKGSDLPIPGGMQAEIGEEILDKMEISITGPSHPQGKLYQLSSSSLKPTNFQGTAHCSQEASWPVFPTQSSPALKSKNSWGSL